MDFVGPGGIVNHKVIFIEDLMYVNIRARTHTYLLTFSIEDFKDLESKHPDLAKRVMMFQNKMLRVLDKKWPLDVKRTFPKGKGHERATVERNHILKNIVF